MENLHPLGYLTARNIKAGSISVTNRINVTGERGRDSRMAGVGPCSSLASPYWRIQRLEQVPFLPSFQNISGYRYGTEPPVYVITFSYS
jgi:hypothetical protein